MLRCDGATQMGVNYAGIFRKGEKSGLGGAVRPGQEGVVLHITAVQALRSEYLAWPVAYFVVIKHFCKTSILFKYENKNKSILEFEPQNIA